MDVRHWWVIGAGSVGEVRRGVPRRERARRRCSASLLAPGSEDWFTWTIAPDASARLLAVMYANARGARRDRAAPARLGARPRALRPHHRLRARRDGDDVLPARPVPRPPLVPPRLLARRLRRARRDRARGPRVAGAPARRAAARGAADDAPAARRRRRGGRRDGRRGARAARQPRRGSATCGRGRSRRSPAACSASGSARSRSPTPGRCATATGAAPGRSTSPRPVTGALLALVPPLHQGDLRADAGRRAGRLLRARAARRGAGAGLLARPRRALGAAPRRGSAA